MANLPTNLLQDVQRQPLILVGKQIGVTVIPPQTPLTGLNYFDGKFLRAEDLQTEQRYIRHLVGLSNQADGPGIAHGFDVSLGGGDTLNIGPGLAIDPAGRVLLLPVATSVTLQDLIERSQEFQRQLASPSVVRSGSFETCELASAAPLDNTPQVGDLYLITLAYAEALCGEEDVFGKLCEEACVTSTDRPFRVEGVVVRAIPLVLQTPLATSSTVSLNQTHLRSLIASAYFRDERNQIASLISGTGLEANTWCFGTEALGGQDVPIAVVSRAGMSTIFLDAWIGRRERIDTSSKRYWQWRMAMRPWDVYLAQIFQFQCQMHNLFQKMPEPGGDADPCRDERLLIQNASQTMAELIQFYTEASNRFVRLRELPVADIDTDLPTIRGGLTALEDLQSQLTSKTQPDFLDRILIRGGIVETPSAGYLPVIPSSTVTVNDQVRRLLGEGVDLRFCVVRPDYIPHALEEAQHMERISLLQGLDNPQDKPRVDVLVPDGEIREQETRPSGQGYKMTLDLDQSSFSLLEAIFRSPGEAFLNTGFGTVAMPSSGTVVSFFGAARGETLSSGGSGFHFAGLSTTQSPDPGGIRGPLGNFFSARPIVGRRPFAAATSATFATASRRDPSQSLAARLANAPSFLNPSIASIEPFIGTLAAVSPGPDSSAMWMTMETVTDPFAMNRHDSTRVSGDIIFIFPPPLTGETEVIVVELRFSGDLQLDERLPETNGEVTLKTHVTGRLSGRVSFTPGGQRELPTVNVSEDVTLIRRQMPGERAEVLVSLPRFGLVPEVVGRVDLRVHRQWTSATEAKVQGLIRPLNQLNNPNALVAQTQDVPLFAASQKENPDVLTPGHVAHETSIRALRRLATLLDDPRFEDVAVRRLFPPPSPISIELIIQATRDWVLFHRRRDIQCSRDLVPPEVRPRRYRLYAVTVADLEERQQLSTALLANDSQTLDRFSPQAVTVVEFGPGIQALQSVPDHVRADWTMHTTPGADIVYGGIASQGEAFEEGQALAIARLGSLIGVLDDVTEVQPEAVMMALPRVPDALIAGVNDGVILVATIEAATICHEVYRLDSGTTNLDAFLQAVSSDNTQDLTSVLNQFNLQRLGRVQFRQGTSTVFMNTINEVIDTWPEAGNGEIRSVITISAQPPQFPPPQDYIEQVQRYQEQTSTISTALGGSIPIADVQHTPTFAAVTPCPAITIMVSEPRIETECNELLLIPNTATPSSFLQFVASIQRVGIPTQLIGLAPSFPRIPVDFEIPANVPVATSLQAFSGFWPSVFPNGLDPDTQLRFIAISPQGMTADEQTSHLAQSSALATEAGNELGHVIDVQSAINATSIFPTSCGALTLAIPVSSEDFSFVPVVLVARDATAASTGSDIGFRFTPTGDVIRDQSFDVAVAALRASGATIERVELAGETEADAADPRLETLFQALQEEGLVSEETERRPSILPEIERPILNQGGLLLDQVFVFRSG